MHLKVAAAYRSRLRTYVTAWRDSATAAFENAVRHASRLKAAGGCPHEQGRSGYHGVRVCRCLSTRAGLQTAAKGGFR